MMHSLLSRTLYDKRWFMLGWSCALAGMVWLVLFLFPAFSQDTATFEAISKQAPQALSGLIGDVSTFTTITGFIATQLYDIRIPLFIMILGLVLAQSISVSEEEKGTLRTLLASPLSRTRIMAEKWLAAIVIISVVTMATVAATYAGLVSISEPAPHELVWQLALITFIFGVTVVTIPLGIAFATGSRGLTMAVGLVSTVGSFILSSFAMSVDWLKSWEVISLMHYYDASSAVKDGLNIVHISVLIALTLIFLLAGLLGFRHRDISGN